MWTEGANCLSDSRDVGADEEVVVVPITDELDLHHYKPRDIGTLIPDYLEECRKLGIFEVRIIHGKGRGVLRKGVHAILEKLPEVVDFRLGDERRGSFGATIVKMKKVD